MHPQQMNKNKSIARAKKSTVKVSEFLAREGAAALVPGGGLLYDAANALFQHGKQYYNDRTEDRLEEFHQALLVRNFDDKKYEEFLEREFDLDDYFAVLSSCAQDIENEKIRIYSQLMQSLIRTSIQPNIRRHFITSSKDLTFSDLCFMKELYINSKYDLMTVGGSSQQVKNLLTTSDIFKKLTIEKLAARGFIHANKSSGMTSIGEQYTESIFSAQELKQESIDRKPWTGINIVIVSYQLDDPLHCRVSIEIQEALWKIQIKSSIHILNENRPTTSLFYGAGVLLVGEREIEDNYKKALEMFSNKKPLIRLNLSNNASDVELKNITFSERFTLQSSNTEEIRRDINDFILKILE